MGVKTLCVYWPLALNERFNPITHTISEYLPNFTIDFLGQYVFVCEVMHSFKR